MKTIFNFLSLIFTPIYHFLFGAKESTFDEDCVDSEADIATHINQTREEFVEKVIDFLEPCDISLRLIESTQWFSNNGKIRNSWPLRLIKPNLVNSVSEHFTFKIVIEDDTAQCSFMDFILHNGRKTWMSTYVLSLYNFNCSDDQVKKCALHILAKVQELEEEQSCQE